MSRYYRIAGVFPEQPMGRELMVFDPRADRVHVLNATSALVWSCLKEGLSPDAAACRLREANGLGPDASVGDILERAMGQFLEKGLVEEESARRGGGSVEPDRTGGDAT